MQADAGPRFGPTSAVPARPTRTVPAFTLKALRAARVQGRTVLIPETKPA